MPEKRSVWALSIDIFDRPGQAFANVAAYPRWRWLPPAFLAVAVLVASLVLTAPLLAAQTQQLMAEQLGRLSGDQATLVREQAARFSTPQVLAITGIATGIVGLAFSWLIAATILYFGALISGGDVEYKRIFATMPWLGVPSILETGLQTAFILYTGKLITNQGLSYLVSTGSITEDMRNLAYVALGQATLFRLWYLVLAYTLLRSVARLSRGSAFFVTVVYWALLLGGQLAFAAASRLLSPGV
jgi:hypothetical protein